MYIISSLVSSAHVCVCVCLCMNMGKLAHLGNSIERVGVLSIAARCFGTRATFLNGAKIKSLLVVMCVYECFYVRSNTKMNSR